MRDNERDALVALTVGKRLRKMLRNNQAGADLNLNAAEASVVLSAIEALTKQPAGGDGAVTFGVFAKAVGFPKPILLDEYVGSTRVIRDRVLSKAMREGFKGTFNERMTELGWWIEPLYTRPAATAQVPFRNMKDGATFEEYRDQLAVGNLTPVDQMAFDNLLHDVLAATAVVPDAERRHIERAIRVLRRDYESPLADEVESIYKQLLAAAPAAPKGGVVDEAAACRLDDYMEYAFDIRIGKRAAHAALTAAIAAQQAEE